MKLIDALKNVDKTEPDYWDVWGIASELNIEIELATEQTRLCTYYLTKWLCTDTWVGRQAIYLDDELVGTSNQTGRKSGVDYKWVSKEALERVRQYLFTLRGVDDYAQYINPEAEIEDTYQLSYAEQLLTSSVLYKGNTHTIKGKLDTEVHLDNGEIVSMKDISIPIQLA